MDNKQTGRYNSTGIETRKLREHRDESVGILHDRSVRMDRDQKALLRMVLDHGATYDQIARLSGEHASTVSRRFRAMVRRLRGGQLAGGGGAGGDLNPLEKTILIESFICGTPQVRLAAKLGISRYRVRKTLDDFRRKRQQAAGH